MKRVHKKKMHVKFIDLKRKDILSFILWGFLVFVGSIFTPICSGLYKLLIDQFSVMKNGTEMVIKVIGAYVGVQFIQELFEGLQKHIEVKVNYGLTNLYIKMINSKMSSISIEEYERQQVYNLIERISKKSNTEIADIVSGIVGIVSPLVTIVTYIIILYNIKWYFVIIILASFLPYFIIVGINSKNKYMQSVEVSDKYRKLKYIDQILSDRIYVKELRIFKAKDFFSDVAKSLRTDISKSQISLIIKNYKISILPHLIINFALALCLIMTSYDFISGKNSSLGDVVFVISAIQSISSNINLIISNILNIYDIKYSLKDWKNFFELEDEVIEQTESEKIKKCVISFENVSYKYPGSENYALKNINFSIKENEKIALVGTNGSGKTTITNLLMGFYEPSEGEIYIDGKPLKNILKQFRSITACIFQNFNRYSLSIKDNITAGNGGEINSDSDIKKLNLYKFIDEIDIKEETILGQIYEGGREVSGGEWQKIAILRGLYKKNVKFMIMDEPTASLDPRAENDLYEEFTKICEKKTLMLISHRLSAAKLCDRIIVLENGNIVEEGSHDELIKEKGKYCKMYQTQKNIYCKDIDKQR